MRTSKRQQRVQSLKDLEVKNKELFGRLIKAKPSYKVIDWLD
jgi:hypothetical protein